MFRRRQVPLITEDFLKRKYRFATIYAFTGFTFFGVLLAGFAGQKSWWNPFSDYFAPRPKPSDESKPPTVAPWRSKPFLYITLKETVAYESEKKRLNQERERLRRKLAYKVAEQKARDVAIQKSTITSSDSQVQSDPLLNSSNSKQ